MRSSLTKPGGCQVNVHEWGDNNGVAFEPAKEHFHVISKHEPHGENFPMLGITFDTRLTMDVEVDSLLDDCSWRVSQILRGAGSSGATNSYSCSSSTC